jgi:predicted MFS family arabinose efflux permease
VVGYLLYCVGAVTAFIALRLALSDAEAGLHSSALAIGVVGAGLTSHRLDGAMSMRLVHVVGLVSIGLAVVLLMWAPALWATLIAAAGVGLGSGFLATHFNQIMAAGGGALARVRLARGTLVAMLASITVPVFIGLGEASGIGWQLALIPGAALVVGALFATRSFEERSTEVVADQARLPRAFWIVWVLIILLIAAEFATVFWAGTLVERRTGVTLAEATLVISAFVGGIIAGRFGLSSHAISSRDPVWMMRVGIALAIVGLLLPWASTSYEAGMIGMFIAGVGLGVLYPLGASIAFAIAPEHARAVSSRLVLASGLAILLAPLILGIAADLFGVVAAWLLVPGICFAAMALTVPVGRDRARRLVGEAPG